LEGEHHSRDARKVPLNCSPSSVKFVKCNVVSWSEQLAVFKEALAFSPTGRIDIVVANAGISGADPVFHGNSMHRKLERIASADTQQSNSMSPKSRS
jgi:NAD(P)-dependent dehydrogenase (short-subunit alcohol dehydrogenase family)